MDESKNMTITGLQTIEYLELKEQLPPDAIRRVPGPETSDGLYGEPTLIAAVIMVTAAGVHALASWLARRRAQNAKEPGFGFTVTISDHTVTLKLTSGAETETASLKSDRTSDILGVLEEALREAGSLESS
jgi:hypothetical protein